MTKQVARTQARSRAKAKKAAIAAAAAATAVGVGFAGPMANAASSHTYFIGFPDWLSIGAGSTLPSDPVAINNAIVGAKDGNPLIGWGTGGVNLEPVWVTWVDGVPEYTLPVGGQTGSHSSANPLYQTTYDTAYTVAYNLYTWLGGCKGSSNRDKCAKDAALKAVKDIPKTIDVPEYGIVEDGYWTTITAGQWVTASDIGDLPSEVQLAYAAYVLQNGGDMSALAPLLNWTAYFTNVNLIAYGDGAIAAGQAYQAFIDSANGKTHEGYDPYAIGEALTGARKIVIIDPDGGKVTIINTDETNNPLELPEIVYPEAGDMPEYEVVQAGGVLDVTVLSLVLVRNPGRANGGLYARFAPIYEAVTGVNPVSPDRQDVLPEGVDPELIAKLLQGDTSNMSLDELGDLQVVLENADGNPIVVTLKADIGWQYDLLSDAPVTGNPIAWANSVASAVFLTNMLTGVDFTQLGEGGYVGDDGTIYYTLPVDELPLFAAQRLVAKTLGTLINQDPESINTPIADALEPLMKILVNIGYTDVVRNEDGTYTRTLDQFDENALFGTQTLTRAEKAQLVGDLITALGTGVGDEITDVNQRAIDRLTKVLEKLEIPVPADVAADLNEAAPKPGELISKVSSDVGKNVSDALTSIEANLPVERPAPTQDELAEGQRVIGTALADAKDFADDVAERVDEAVKESNDRAAARETAVKDAVAEAKREAKKTAQHVADHVRDAGEKVKNALKPKKQKKDGAQD